MRSGHTVEVGNTDAEGRLILADAISRAVEDEPDYLIETSTLTGAQLVALGSRVIGASRRCATGSVPQATGPAKPCGRCRCPRTCAAAWTPP